MADENEAREYLRNFVSEESHVMEQSPEAKAKIKELIRKSRAVPKEYYKPEEIDNKNI